jgi:hypothetical protein
MKDVIEYLLSAREPWVRYRTMIDLLDKSENDPEVLSARTQMINHPLFQGLFDEMQTWPGTVLSSHKSAGQLYHKLEFLADAGVKKDDFDSARIVSDLTGSMSGEGLFRLSANIPTHFGGTGEDIRAWALCDAPVLHYVAAKMNLTGGGALVPGLNYLVSLVRENGWPCAVSPELGKFRGPGRKADPCPYATLIMLKLLALNDEYRNSDAATIGIESLLHLWETSAEQHPYMFYMGTDFRKLKAPFIWYDILHVADTLSLFETARSDPRWIDMTGFIFSKADASGFYGAESVWKAWKGWDFGEKGIPSPWITFLVKRIERRMSGNI